MKTTFTARHFEASKKLQDYSREYVQKLDQYYDRIVMCDIILQPTASDENPQQAELILKVPRKVLTAKEASSTYEQAIHDVVETMGRQLKKYKEKMYASN